MIPPQADATPRDSRTAGTGTHYWRISGFYFFYFAVLGALVPYWGLYLESIDFSAVQIGNLMALLMVSRIVAPNVWGWIADHGNQRMAVVRWAGFLSATAFVGVFAGDSFAWLAIVMAMFSFFWNASLPQLEAATMNHFGGRAGAYARVRVWGSIGFIVAVVALGLLLDRTDTWWLLPVMLALLIGVWGFSLLVSETGFTPGAGERIPLRRVLLRRDVLAFLFAGLLMQASHGPYYTFYSIYLNDLGYTKTVIGGLWALGVIAEVVIFMFLRHVQARIGLRDVLLASFALAALRWLLIGVFPQYPLLLVGAQLLHAATFGTFHAAAIEMVHRLFTGRNQIRGQALYGSLSFGVGGALGSFYSGLSWGAWGASATFIIAAGLALAALLVTVSGVRSTETAGDGSP